MRAVGWRTQVLAVLLAAAAIVLGLLGLLEYDPLPAGADWSDKIDVLYRALQLFALEFQPLLVPDPAAGPDAPAVAKGIPVVLQVARFLAPAATVSAVVAGASASLGRAVRAWRHRSGPPIVIGDTPRALTVARAMQAAGWRVVRIPDGGKDSLREVDVRAAMAVYACDDLTDSEQSANDNVDTALRVLQIQPRLAGAVYAHIGGPALALKRRVGAWSQRPVPTYEYFNLDELTAQAYIAGENPNDFAGGSPRILIAGATALGEAFLLAFARWWRTVEGPAARVSVTLVDAHASAAAERYRAQWPVVAQVCEIDPREPSLAAVLQQDGANPPDRIFICYADEASALSEAEAVDHAWPQRRGKIVLRSGHRSAPLVAKGPLVAIGAEQLALVMGQGLDLPLWYDVAMNMHAWYLEQETARGTAMGATTAMHPWHDLNDDMKEANYGQARDVLRKLRLIGARVSPITGSAVPFHVTDPEVERLAMLEHGRWMREREARGWTYAAKRNDDLKQHPHLVAWSKLPEDVKEKDRSAIRTLDRVHELLGGVGLQIVRGGPVEHDYFELSWWSRLWRRPPRR